MVVHQSMRLRNIWDVTTEFLNDTITAYREKYGVCITVDNYIIYFIPYLAIMEKI